jgi:hypothetical protein
MVTVILTVVEMTLLKYLTVLAQALMIEIKRKEAVKCICQFLCKSGI